MREFFVSCSGAGVEGLKLGEMDIVLEVAFALAFLITSVL